MWRRGDPPCTAPRRPLFAAAGWGWAARAVRSGRVLHGSECGGDAFVDREAVLVFLPIRHDTAIPRDRAIRRRLGCRQHYIVPLKHSDCADAVAGMPRPVEYP